MANTSCIFLVDKPGGYKFVKSLMDIHDNDETGILYRGFPDNEEEKTRCGFQSFYATNGPGVELPSYLPRG